MAKDLMDYAPKEAPAEDDEEALGPKPKAKPSLMDRKVQWLAEKTGVEDPEALVKLIDCVVAKRMVEYGGEE